METGLTTALAVLLVASVAAPALFVSATSTASATSSTCDQAATHNAFRTDAAVQTMNESGKAVSSVSNTEVVLETTTGFVKLHADNPNGYCVAFTVEISPEIISPADLGKIESNDNEDVATWRAATNLSSGVVYTRVTFVLGPGQNATFAPSTLRVQSLAWTGQAKNRSTGIFDGFSSFWGDDKLQKRQYTIRPSGNASRITVPLQNKDGEKIEEWQASYTLNGETRSVSQDASAPVYYTESASSVTFHFSERAVREDAKVTFVAEPTFVEKATFGASNYASAWEKLGGWFGLTISPGEVTV